MRKRFVLLAMTALVATAGILGGCGSSSTTTTAAPTTVTTTAPPTSATTAPATTETTGSATTTSASPASEGKTLFEANCSGCHGVSGEGGVGPTLIGISEAGNVIVVVTSGRENMPSFQAKLTADQIKAIADYVTTLK